MAAKTYCQSCYRILQVPEDSVGRKIRCPCGNSFRVEKPLSQVQEEQIQAEHRRLGREHLARLARRRLAQPQYRRGPFTGTLVSVLLLVGTVLYVEQALYIPPPEHKPPVRVRLMFASPEPRTDESGTSVRDPVQPPDLPGLGPSREEPGEGENEAPSEVVLASSKKPQKDREGAKDWGKWRLVPEEAKRLWDLKGLDTLKEEGRKDPDQVLGHGPPAEGAATRPNPADEEKVAEGDGRPGSDPELEALARMAEEARGGGTRFYGSPIPLDAEGIVFVIDRSSSMMLPVAAPKDAPKARRRWTKLDLAKWELKKAIALLPDAKSFNVIFFDSCLERWRYVLHPATAASKRDAYRWIDQIQPQGQTNVSEAIVAALGHEEVNMIVLLSDGRPNVIDCRTENEAPAKIHLEKIRQSNREKEPIWCFSFSEDDESEAFLRDLAEMTGGQFTAVAAQPF